MEKQDQHGRAIPACQFFLIPRLQKQLELLLTLLSSESKSPHKDVYFFQVHSFLAAIFAVLSDLLPWHDDISVLPSTASSLTGCTAPCKHPQSPGRLLLLVERETEAGGRAVTQPRLLRESRRPQELSSGFGALAARPSFPSELGYFKLPPRFIMYRIFVRRAK